MRNLGLADVNIASSAGAGRYVAALAVDVSGRVVGSWASGVIAKTNLGSAAGLAARVSGWVAASYSSVDISGASDAGGLVYRLGSGGQIVASYATGSVSAIAPAGFLYSDGTTGEATDDDGWDFGDAWTHPVLKFGGANTARQVQLLPGNPPTFSAAVPDATLDNGAAIDPITVPAATGGDGSTYTYAASGLPPGLVFDADGTGQCEAARTVCGAPTAWQRFTTATRERHPRWGC